MAAMNTTREAAGALAGLLAGAVALGVSELTAAATGARGAPVVAVGETAINLTPIPVKEFAITHFGTHDKEALIAGILVMLAGFAAVIGLLALRRLAFGLAGLAAFAAVGVAAAIRLPAAAPADIVPTLAGAAVAMVSLWLLMRSIRMVWKTSGGVATVSTGMDRRRLLIAGVAGRGRRWWPRGRAGWGAFCWGAGGPRPGRSGCPLPPSGRRAGRPGPTCGYRGSPRSSRRTPASTAWTPTWCCRSCRRTPGR